VSPERQIEAVAQFGRYLWQDPSIEDLVQEATRLVADGTRADAALVLERTVGNRLSTARASIGFAEPPGVRDLALGTAWHGPIVLETPGRIAIIDDLRDQPGEPPVFAAQGLRAAAAALIGDPARPYGVLAVYSRARGAFDAGVVPFLSSLATALGLAIRRTQLTAELNREREERFRLGSLVEGSDDAIITATLQGTILSWNPGAERLYGYAAHEIVGQNLSRLAPAGRDPAASYLMERVRAGERIPAFDAEHRRKDGSRVTVSLSLSPVHGREGEIVALAGIAHDVTETRRLESHVRQSAKMEAVGRLAGGVAHDFNNMLTVIDGYSELALLKLPADSPVRPLVEEIHKAGERAGDLTRQLMAFSRKSMAEPQVLDLSAVVAATAATLTRIIGEDIRIETRLAPDLQNVMADRSQLDQVLFNLVINARDAMPLGGTIAIETANVAFHAAHGVGPREVPPGQYVLLAVTDTGVGMDAATRARIFEPFFTTKGSGRGTGLGLATVQNFVMQIGGHLAVYSEPGHGSTFKIYLPTVALPLATARGENPADAPAGTETILVVEDDDAVRLFTEGVLKAAGYEVLTASNGAEALDLAQGTATPIHLLMADVVMPVLGGHALAEQMHPLHPETRVLFTSGYTPDAVRGKGMAIPSARFLQKPYAPAALCRKVRGVLDG